LKRGKSWVERRTAAKNKLQFRSKKGLELPGSKQYSWSYPAKKEAIQAKRKERGTGVGGLYLSRNRHALCAIRGAHDSTLLDAGISHVTERDLKSREMKGINDSGGGIFTEPNFHFMMTCIGCTSKKIRLSLRERE